MIYILLILTIAWFLLPMLKRTHSEQSDSIRNRSRFIKRKFDK